MPERSNGMIQEHAGTGPAHHLPDPGPHVRVVAMYRTFTACGLYFGRSETAMFQTVNGICHKFRTIGTEGCVAVPMPALHPYHQLHNEFLFFQTVMHALRA